MALTPRLDPKTEADAAPLSHTLQKYQRRRDMARLFPALGVVLFTSPLLDVFGRAGTLGGIPLGMVYIFGVWAVLIIGSAVQTRFLLRDSGNG